MGFTCLNDGCMGLHKVKMIGPEKIISNVKNTQMIWNVPHRMRTVVLIRFIFKEIGSVEVLQYFYCKIITPGDVTEASVVNSPTRSRVGAAKDTLWVGDWGCGGGGDRGRSYSRHQPALQAAGLPRHRRRDQDLQ